MKSVVLSTLLALAACTDFATPAELEEPQILAIQSEPASIGPGDSALLSILVADQNGPVLSPSVTWSLPNVDGAPARGSLAVEDGAVRYTAPESIDSLPALVTLEARVQHGDQSLVAIKAMLIGGPSLVNPVISDILVDGQPADTTITLPAGTESTLSINTTSELSSDATYAWYARPGSIEAYRSTPTRIVAPETSGEGWLYVVVRDQGGIAYRSLPMKVE